jgi:lactate dehydrogenase-like 2-hydroxyacid dehydrogenase
MKPVVFVTRRIPGEGLNRLREHCEVRLWEEAGPVPRAVLLREIGPAAGLISMLSDPIDAEVLAAAPALRMISQYAVGYDNIDLAAAAARGIGVGNTPDVLTEATADLAFALLMAAARRVVEGMENVRRGEWITWGPEILLGQDVWGATLGIVGLGRIGQAMARRARGFGMPVLYTGREMHPEAAVALQAEYVTLEELLEHSDYISLHCPLTPQTRGLIGEAELRRMKSTAILINTARGPVVQSAALERALREGWIAGAGLDVTDPEPLPAAHPLAALPNCVITPHIASGSVKTRVKMTEITVDNLLAGLRGERPAFCVNPQVYERK